MEAPIFIVGANRSGTTLLRLILNAHSRIAIPEELSYFRTYVAGVSISKWRRPPLSRERYAAFVRRFLDKKCQPLEGLDLECIRREILEAEVDLRRPYQTVLESWARMNGKARWGEKTPGNLFYSDVIVDMFPDARFIHMVRDPRAGVLSMMEASMFPEDIVFNALSRHKHMTEGRAVLERHVPPARRMNVRYEDLVASPVETVRSVCAFLGESYEPQMMRFYEDASRFMMPEAAGDFNAAATRPISTRMKDKWRQKLSPAEIAMIERICAPEMEEFGYEFLHPVLPPSGWLNLLIKKAYWDYQCRRSHTMRHYTVKHRMFARSRKRLARLRPSV